MAKWSICMTGRSVHVLIHHPFSTFVLFTILHMSISEHMAKSSQIFHCKLTPLSLCICKLQQYHYMKLNCHYLPQPNPLWFVFYHAYARLNRLPHVWVLKKTLRAVADIMSQTQELLMPSINFCIQNDCSLQNNNPSNLQEYAIHNNWVFLHDRCMKWCQTPIHHQITSSIFSVPKINTNSSL